MEENYRNIVNKLMLYIFILSVSMTMFGPIFHYIGWALSIFLLIFIKYKNNEGLLPSFTGEGKIIFYLLSIFFLFSVVVYFFNTPDHSEWLRASSISFEILIGFLLAGNILNDGETRKKFINIFSATNILGLLWLILTQTNSIKFSSGTFFNHNIIGFYMVIIFPLVFMNFVFYCKNIFLQSVAFCVIFASIMLSLSSITWPVSFVQLIIMLIYIKNKYNVKIFKRLIFSAVLLVLFAFIVNLNGNGSLVKRLNIELNQMTGIDNLDKLTSNRVEVWETAIAAVKQKTVLGHGHDQFSKIHKAFLVERYGAKDWRSSRILTHPHNMYLEVAFETGIFGMLLFISALILPVISIARHYINKGLNEDFPWSVIFFTVFFGQLIYGIAGESLFDMRRDLSVVFWTMLGIYSVYPFKGSQNEIE